MLWGRAQGQRGDKAGGGGAVQNDPATMAALPMADAPFMPPPPPGMAMAGGRGGPGGRGQGGRGQGGRGQGPPGGYYPSMDPHRMGARSVRRG